MYEHLPKPHEGALERSSEGTNKVQASGVWKIHRAEVSQIPMYSGGWLFYSPFIYKQTTGNYFSAVPNVTPGTDSATIRAAMLGESRNWARDGESHSFCFRQ